MSTKHMREDGRGAAPRREGAYVARHLRTTEPAPAALAEAAGEGQPGARVAEAGQADGEGRSPAPAAARESGEATEQAVNRSTAMMGMLVIVSRVTGFFRTWGQAFALGVTALASCYSVANALPNTIYELVMGGMLITAFLPVYLSAKRESGREGANAYASNLLSIVTVLMMGLTVLSWVFAAQIVWTQSFSASADFDVDLTIYFFRFFSVEIVLYALSSIISGVLNAERDFFWSNAASIFNNVVATASFLIYAALVNTNPGVALVCLALGNPLGVLVQVLVQVPSLRRHGVRFTLRLDFRDPRLRETLTIGIPTLVVTLVSFPTTAVMTSCALQATAAGASISYYSRLWFMLPYSIFAIPVTVAMFTELSDYAAAGDMERFVAGIGSGINRMMLFLMPFMVYLIVFSPYLVTVIGAGRFGPDDIRITALFLAGQALQLPLYGLSTYLQKVCSALRKMTFYTVATCLAAVIQIAFCLVATPRLGIVAVALSSILYFGPIDLVVIAYLHRQIGSMRLWPSLTFALKMLVLGVLGGALGWLVVTWLPRLAGLEATSLVGAVVLLVAGGIPAVALTYGIMFALKIPEASFVSRLLRR